MESMENTPPIGYACNHCGAAIELSDVPATRCIDCKTNGVMPVRSADDFVRMVREGIEPLTREQFHSTKQVGGLWDKLRPDDVRRTTLKTKGAFYNYCYNILTSDEPLTLYFDRRLAFVPIRPVPDAVVENGRIATASNRNNVRPLRNLNLEAMLGVTASDGVSLKNAYKEGLETGKVLRAFTMPSIFRTSVLGDYESLVVCLKTCTGQPSVFSPVVYKALLKELVKHSDLKPERLLVPSASWGSPVLATSDAKLYKEVHIVDVMSQALDSCTSLHRHVGAMRPVCKLKTTCVRSEIMSSAVRGWFDHVFFCPPYYDLELYPGRSQSTETTSSYEEWLNSYWRATVRECVELMEPGGVFAFVTGRKIRGYDMGADMARIASEVFSPCEEIEISPGKESRRDSNKVKKSECCYIFRYDGHGSL